MSLKNMLFILHSLVVVSYIVYVNASPLPAGTINGLAENGVSGVVSNYSVPVSLNVLGETHKQAPAPASPNVGNDKGGVSKDGHGTDGGLAKHTAAGGVQQLATGHKTGVDLNVLGCKTENDPNSADKKAACNKGPLKL